MSCYGSFIWLLVSKWLAHEIYCQIYLIWILNSFKHATIALKCIQNIPWGSSTKDDQIVTDCRIDVIFDVEESFLMLKL